MAIPVVERLLRRTPEPLNPTEEAKRFLVDAGGLRLIKKAAKGLKQIGKHFILVAETTPTYYRQLGTDERYKLSIYWDGESRGWDPELHESAIFGKAVSVGVVTDEPSIEVRYTDPSLRYGWATVSYKSLTLEEKIQFALDQAKKNRIYRNGNPYHYADMRPSNHSLYGRWKVLSFKS